MFLDRYPDNINLLRSGRKGCAFIWRLQTCLEDITASPNISDVLPGLRPQGFAQFLDTFAERTVRHRSPFPHLVDQFVFTDEVPAIGDETLEHRIGLRTQVHDFVAAKHEAAAEVEGKVVEQMNDLVVHFPLTSVGT